MSSGERRHSAGRGAEFGVERSPPPRILRVERLNLHKNTGGAQDDRLTPRAGEEAGYGFVGAGRPDIEGVQGIYDDEAVRVRVSDGEEAVADALMEAERFIADGVAGLA